ncbi:MAG: peptidase family protein [Ilumatobacteraceae bacterium]|nr:peptidase family protein [Ilumatobacteraceae bacterium]
MQMRLSAPAAFVVMIGLSLSACGSDDTGTVAGTTPVVSAATLPLVTATTIGPATAVAPGTTAAPTTTEQATTTTVASTTTGVPTTTVDSQLIETRQLGQSVEGRPIVAERRGTPGGRVVLVIGVIHGDEHDGLAILEQLHRLDVPAGVDLWLVDSMNPDGVAHNTRQNADQVDLNRNFPSSWGHIGVPGDDEYAGQSAASEPETQAMVAFITDIRPDITIWYHQNLNRIAPGRGRDGAIRDRYSELTGIPIIDITGGTYTGVAATWARKLLKPGVAFIVELGDSVSDAEAQANANAVLTIAAESD